jgi:hypothetical protein
LTLEGSFDMRMTLPLDDDACGVARDDACAQSLDLGRALSALIRRSGVAKLPMRQVDGAWVVDLPTDAAPLTASRVQKLLDESA